MGRLFGTNGVRGVFGKELTLEVALRLSYALGVYYKDKPILVGYDGRHSNTILARIVTAGLNAMGIDTADGGLMPTPCLQYAVKHLGYKGGVMITASHNTPEYNGIKVMDSTGVEISREDELVIEDFYFKNKFQYANSIGKNAREENAIARYIEGIKSLVDVESIRKRAFTVVLDLGNGAQAVTAPRLLKELGCKVITINEEIDGSFPGRGSEPTLDNLSQLSRVVMENNADLGIAYDGDGDRSIFCDEKGVIHAGDRSGAILLEHILEKERGVVVTPISTSIIIDKIAEKYNCKVIKTKVGSVDVSRTMLVNAIAGLEENGGFMYGKHLAVRDGAMSSALMLEAMLKAKCSQLIEMLPRYYSYKTKFPCTREQADRVVKYLIETHDRVDRLDGAKVWLDDDTWIMVRASGTEPLMRLYAESNDKKRLDSIVKEYSEKINNMLKSYT